MEPNNEPTEKGIRKMRTGEIASATIWIARNAGLLKGNTLKDIHEHVARETFNKISIRCVRTLCIKAGVKFTHDTIGHGNDARALEPFEIHERVTAIESWQPTVEVVYSEQEKRLSKVDRSILTITELLGGFSKRLKRLEDRLNTTKDPVLRFPHAPLPDSPALPGQDVVTHEGEQPAEDYPDERDED